MLRVLKKGSRSAHIEMKTQKSKKGLEDQKIRSVKDAVVIAGVTDALIVGKLFDYAQT